MAFWTTLQHGLGGLNELEITTTGLIITAITTVLVLHQLLVFLDYPVLSIGELAWNAASYLTPAQLLLDRAKRQELRHNNMISQTHAAKSEALRQMLGLSSGAIMSRMPVGAKNVVDEGGRRRSVVRRMSQTAAAWVGRSIAKSDSDVPPGLGNWDNSCYQNSILQGLSSLHSFRSYLAKEQSWYGAAPNSTKETLLETISRLIGDANNGKTIWTPSKLKSMSSWQQQDAQEYFSKIMDELDKEAVKCSRSSASGSSLDDVIDHSSRAGKGSKHAAFEMLKKGADLLNPLEGLIAQRVACTRCGFSEGLSMIPFNCLTVPLGSAYEYDLSQCLDEYTGLEEITDVDCAKCTLLKSETSLRRMLAAPVTPRVTPEPGDCANEPHQAQRQTLALPPEMREIVLKRLQAVETALADDDFEDETLSDECQIPKSARVSSTKTRQAVIGRPPRSLVIHINRSQFNEFTGAQRKNYAAVRYPLSLKLGQWTLGGGLGDQPRPWNMEATQSILGNDRADPGGPIYQLRAVITHYGRHENGHYIASRRHAARAPAINEEAIESDNGPDTLHTNAGSEPWWRLSDEDVSSVSEEDVLAQGGVFMLFYERQDTNAAPLPVLADRGNAVSSVGEQSVRLVAVAELETAIDSEPPRPPMSSVEDDDILTNSTSTETDSEIDSDKVLPLAPRPMPMRTARGRGSRSENVLRGGLRPMAAT